MATHGELGRDFPSLRPDDYRDTSPPDSRYNCVAWTADDTSRWWWPDEDGDGYWPQGEGIQRVLTLSDFLAAYRTIGYTECESGQLEAGFEKVAIYARSNRPTHAARQLPDGTWTSKLGEGIDIWHKSLDCIGGGLYGDAVAFMRRPV